MPQKKVKIEQEKKIDLKKVIGERIKRARHKRERTAQWVTDRVKDLTRSGLSQIENGVSNINAVQLWKIATVLHADLHEFFPVVPDCSSPDKEDIEKIRKEDEEAAKLMSDAYAE